MRGAGGWIGCLAAVLAGGTLTYLAWYVVFGRPAGPEKVADRFLALGAGGRTEEAMRRAAPALRARTTPLMLGLQLKKVGIESFSASAWTDVRVEEREATLEGVVTTGGGDDIPLVVKLVRPEGEWLVLSFAAPSREGSGQEGSSTERD
jgi:hypothetical protein